ncbi:hypothetical protein [Cytobacillus sp.]|uniref:hypothetical protein n=1 Tax=Cytobacillus sp. TaxID=2675269 RepID=UPI0028BF15EA|nr:hypothetical protein [Cytobacillus sp.]
METYETYFKAFSVPVSVIFTMLVDQYVYDMPTLVGGLVAGCLVGVFYKIVDKTSFLKKELNKKTNYILSLLACISIILSFYLFKL